MPICTPTTLARSRTGPSSFAGARRGLSVGCLLLCACLGCRRAEPPAAEKAPPATVVWKTASLNALEEWTELVGTTVPVPDHSARVSAAVEGRVISVLGESNGKPLAEGQRVEKGTVLAQLDPSITQANLAKAEADRGVLR